MATHSSILAWKIPWTEEPVGYSAWDPKESDTTEWTQERVNKERFVEFNQGRRKFLIGCTYISLLHSFPKKGSAEECSSCCTIALISHTSKVMLKILQARLQQYMNHELSDVQAGFRKDRGTRDQIANIRWIIEKARVPEKHLFLLYWLCQSLWLCGSQ